ncbi:MAG: hypothetical protein J0651_00410, partial [Actinobacteria bacterium]|nr:hypothetical protein [Actinomycetota bacterium]
AFHAVPSTNPKVCADFPQPISSQNRFSAIDNITEVAIESDESMYEALESSLNCQHFLRNSQKK